MKARIWEFLAPFLEIRAADVLDILFVTFLLSSAIAWIRRTKAGLAATGILILGVVYLLARALGLQLTAWIFQGFFAVFVIMAVVIFQEELRQFFERLAVFGLGRESRPGASDPTDILVSCLSDFARDRIGALVVLPGKQPLARHIHGGIELHGFLSVPLLKSIFDPHSPGHDGAVIVEDGKVTLFATHLPLSHDTRQLEGVGTRHAAALGLAEKTDALCLVVSEERGQISVAHRGKLRRVAGPNELARVLAAFFAEQRPAERKTSWVRQALRQNTLEVAVSFVLVVGLWYVLIPGSRTRQATFEVPVQVTNLPAEFDLAQVEPERVKVVLSGPARSFYLLDRDRLAVTVDATLAKVGRRTFRLAPENVERPASLVVEDIRPSSVRISVRRGGNSTESGAAR
ncbi:MAG: adenylate cyclase [Candidatus Binatia bacterium]|nr:MAG: adenylate cyclase [Candidatus Binatia bacterium]